MVPYDKMILNRLLDSYEQSSLATGENVRTINIEMRFTPKTIPVYFDESAAEYEQIHIWAKRLEEKELITILWKNRKVDHIIEKVRLNMDHITPAYEYVKRVPKANREEMMLSALREYMDPVTGSLTICGKFVMYLIRRIQEHRSVKEYISLDDPGETKQLLNAVKAVEENDQPLYIREFSIRTFHDSKAFEKMENKVAGIFRRFHDGFGEMDTTEILAEYHIYHTPNYVYLKGNGFVRIGAELINLSILKQGIGISGDDIDRIHFMPRLEEAKKAAAEHIKKVITIENLTAFFRFSEEHSLIIYLGGYHNTSRRMLLKKIYEKIPDAQYYHFGDIDAGGFQIFDDLKKRTGIPFEMLHMDLDTLMKYRKYGKPLTNEDRKRLGELAGRREIADVVAYMLEHNVKLEQECILIKKSGRVEWC